MQRKKVLAVLKTTRLARMRMNKTEFRAGQLMQRMKIFGGRYDIRVTRELQLQEGQVLTHGEYELVFSIGGDGTFVRAASFIEDASLPLIGVNSDTARSRGKLTCMRILEDNQELVDSQLAYLSKGGFKVSHRSRLTVNIISGDYPDAISTHYALNEAFLADQHPTVTAMSMLKVDKEEPLKVANSGIVVSSGTGSTGWLSSALWRSPLDIKHIFSIVDQNRGRAIKATKEAAHKFNNEIEFNPDTNFMFYYIREPTPKFRDERQEEQQKLFGFAKQKISAQNQSYSPWLFIDGINEFPLGLEDKINITVDRNKDIIYPHFEEQ